MKLLLDKILEHFHHHRKCFWTVLFQMVLGKEECVLPGPCEMQARFGKYVNSSTDTFFCFLFSTASQIISDSDLF